MRYDVVDTPERHGLAVSGTLLGELREARPVDPLARDEVLTPGRSADTENARDVAMRKGCRRSASFSKLRCRT